MPIGSESDCLNLRIATILDEASGKSFEVLYFADSVLFDVNRNNDDLYDFETMLASISVADEIIRDKRREEFNAKHRDFFD